MESPDLYDPAAGMPPIWHVDRGWSLFIGPLTLNAKHSHSVPVLIAGLYAPFRLCVCDAPWQTCRAAVIPAGVPYALDVGGAPLAVLYLEPATAGVADLHALIDACDSESGVRLGDPLCGAVLRELYEDRAARTWLADAVMSLLTFARPRAHRAVDPRIARVLAELQTPHHDAEPLAAVANRACLSPSRFQHVFVREVGVSFNRYRLWQRLRAAICEVAGGASLTSAAYGAGYFDQAHFSRQFRTTFGAPPSPTLRHVRR